MFSLGTNLPQGLFKACVVPRPIAWISTIDKNGGTNLAPFSFFNIVSEDPPMVMFATTNSHIEGGPKDTLKNIEDTGEFVISLATYQEKDAMNLSSGEFPRGCSEFDAAGIETEPAQLVKAPRVKNAPVHLECKLYRTVQLPTNSPKNINRMVIGTVVGINIKPEILTDGRVDIKKMGLISRLGYQDYEKVGQEIFSIPRPVAKALPPDAKLGRAKL